MIDVTTLDRITLCEYSNLYVTAKICLKCNPEKQNRIEQEQMREWLSKNYDALYIDDELPQYPDDLFSKDSDVGEFWRFLKNCYTYATNGTFR